MELFTFVKLEESVRLPRSELAIKTINKKGLGVENSRQVVFFLQIILFV